MQRRAHAAGSAAARRSSRCHATSSSLTRACCACCLRRGRADAGPIIEQDVTRVTHRDSVANLIRKGKDLERIVLARAVRAHLEDRVIVHSNRAVVFDETS